MAASCALLGSSKEALATDAEQPWQLDTGVLYYKEDQGRVQTVEPIVSLKKDFGEEHVLGLSFAYDSLSGGSPNGAIPAKKVQTFASPSGGGSKQSGDGESQTFTTSSGTVVAALSKVSLYTAQPGELPLDPSFHDQRYAGDLTWSQPVGTANHVSVGGHLSHELDFLSLSANGAISQDLNNRNTTLSGGVNAEFDRIEPIGGAPQPNTDYTQLLKQGNQTKNLLGGLLGLTQVMTRRWVAQINYSFVRSSGYLTDPYKIVSVVDGTGAVNSLFFERRPNKRVQQSLYVGNKVAVGRNVLDASYRYGTDDWGIASNTLDARLRIPIGAGLYVEPHARWYHQSAADFYHLYLNQPGLLPNSTLGYPAYVSADPRLAAFTGTTFGVKVGTQLGDFGELSLRLEQYQQKPSAQSSSLPLLQGLNLNPGLKALLVQLGWRYAF